jgi:hypothetical protein
MAKKQAFTDDDNALLEELGVESGYSYTKRGTDHVRF